MRIRPAQAQHGGPDGGSATRNTSPTARPGRRASGPTAGKRLAAGPRRRPPRYEKARRGSGGDSRTAADRRSDRGLTASGQALARVGIAVVEGDHSSGIAQFSDGFGRARPVRQLAHPDAGEPQEGGRHECVRLPGPTRPIGEDAAYGLRRCRRPYPRSRRTGARQAWRQCCRLWLSWGHHILGERGRGKKPSNPAKGTLFFHFPAVSETSSARQRAWMSKMAWPWSAEDWWLVRPRWTSRSRRASTSTWRTDRSRCPGSTSCIWSWWGQCPLTARPVSLLVLPGHLRGHRADRRQVAVALPSCGWGRRLPPARR